MNKEEFINAVQALDKKQGHFPFTRMARAVMQRELMLQSTHQMMVELLGILLSRGEDVFVYEKMYDKKNMYCFADLLLTRYNIYIVFYDGMDEEDVKRKDRVFLGTCHNYYPFFVDITRDSMEWTLEKLENCMKQAEKEPKKGPIHSPVMPARRKRITVKKYEKVTRR